MMKSGLLRSAACTTTILGGLAAATPSLAQPSDLEDTVIKDEIIVTARKTEETLLDVPLSISAISEQEILRSGIDNIADVALQTPGFSFRQGFGRAEGGANSRPAIRGMSNVLGAPNAGFFVDGIFVADSITSYQLDNLQRVEVIRGPQAALFGRNTFAGAVNFVTRDPGDEVQGRITASAAEHDAFELNGYLSGPIKEGLLYGEINGRFNTFGGDYENADGGEDLGSQETTNIGTKLVFTPSDAFTARVNLGYSKVRDGGFAYGGFGSNNLNCFLPNVTGSFFGIDLSSNRSRGYFCGEIEVPDTLAFNDAELNQLGYDGIERDTFRSSLQMDWDLANGYTLTSVTAYNTSDNINIFDNALVSSATPNFSIGKTSRNDFSQELRILSPRDKQFRWLAGGYYFEQNRGEGFDAGGTFNANGQSNRPRLFDSGDKVENIAAFAMIEYDATEDFTLSLEGRYQEDTITATDEVLAAPDATVRPAFNNIREAKFDSFLPRFTARYSLNDNTNIYGSIAKGNKPGGFNPVPTSAEFFDQQDFAEFTRDFAIFEEESIWSYELGIKGQDGTGRLNYNVAAYYIDWSDQQLTQSQPYLTASSGGRSGTTFPAVVNAGESEIFGFEAELFGSIDRFDYSLGYSYTNAELKDFYDENAEELFDTDGIASGTAGDVDGFNGQLAGNKLPQTPAHQINASGTYTVPIGDDADWFARADYNYESKRYVQVFNLAHTGDSHMLNLQTGIDKGNWNLTAFYNNALGDDTPLVVTRLLDFNRTLLIPDPVRSFIFLPNRRFTFYRDFTISGPRKSQFGVRASYKF